MSAGPVEYVVIEFTGNRFDGRIVPALRDLVSAGRIRILDIAFVRKDDDGNSAGIELDALDPADGRWFDELDGELEDLLNDEDLEIIAAGLAPKTSAGVLVWEDLWAAPLADAVRDANGRIVSGGRIPPSIFDDARMAATGA